MTEATSEALDQALWLHQAPARRNILQARPLAEGQELLLRIAAGSAEALATAAAATGQPPERLEEATRFYLQQVLFTDDADAYRVLGLQRGARTEAIRHHHRLLQRWLHPDRSDDPWNEVYAARVNQAWTALRDGPRREQYDASLPELPARAPMAATRWQAPEPPGATRDPARWLAYAAVAGCAVLVAILLLRSDEPPAWGDPPPAIPPLALVDEPSAAAPGAAATRAQPAPEAPRPADRPQAPVASAIPEPPPSAVPEVETAIVQLPLAAPIPLREEPSPSPAAPAARVAPAEGAGEPQLAQAEIESPGIERVASAPRRSVTLAVPVPASPAPPPVPAQPIPTPTTPTPPTPTLASAPEYTPPGDPLLYMQQAEASLRKAIAYLADPAGVPPPLWNDPRAAEGGADQHAGLRARLPAERATRIELSGSHWVLGEDRASFGADYTALAGRSGAEQGRLSLELVRREELWLVADLRLEPAL